MELPRSAAHPLGGYDQPYLAVITTGVAMGNVRLRVDVHDTPPPLALDGWDEAAEISIQVPHGTVHVGALGFDMEDDFGTLTPAGAGPYRVRVHARDRHRMYDLVAEEPWEEHLIQVWPAPERPAEVLKRSDKLDRWGISRADLALIEPYTMPPPLIGGPPQVLHR